MKKIVALCVFVCVFVAVSASAQQNKVVVIPMGSSKPTIAAYAEANDTTLVGTADQIIRSVSLEVPGKGLVIVNASGNVYVGVVSGDALRCSISQTAFRDSIQFDSGFYDAGLTWIPFAATRAIPVNAGTQTFNFVCDTNNNNISVQDVTLNAVFHSMPDIVVPALLAPAQLNGNSSCPDGTDPSCN